MSSSRRSPADDTQQGTLVLSDVDLSADAGGHSLVWVSIIIAIAVMFLWPAILVGLWWVPVALLIDLVFIATAGALTLMTPSHLTTPQYFYQLFVEKYNTTEDVSDPFDTTDNDTTDANS